jgi:hypothetical protein
LAAFKRAQTIRPAPLFGQAEIIGLYGVADNLVGE